MYEGGVHEDGAQPDVGPEPAVRIARGAVEHQVDPLSLDQPPIGLAGGDGVVLRTVRRMLDPRRVHAQIAHDLEATADLRVQRVGVHDARDVRGTQLGLRVGRGGGGDESREQSEPGEATADHRVHVSSDSALE
jgi:hypothetical protein